MKLIKKIFRYKKLEKNDLQKQFYLDDSSKFDIIGTSMNTISQRWINVDHCYDKRRALNLSTSEKVNFNCSIKIEDDFYLYIRYTSSNNCVYGGDIIFNILFVDDFCLKKKIIASLNISLGKQPKYWRSAEFDISWLSGHQGRFQITPQLISDNNRLNRIAIADFVVSRKDKLSLVKAKAFNELRIKNENKHFSFTYKNNRLYTIQQNLQLKLNKGKNRVILKNKLKNNVLEKRKHIELVVPEPKSTDVAYGYVDKILLENISSERPNFINRLYKKIEAKNKIKILSLCSGSARIEASFANKVIDHNVEWTLLDINKKLLHMASKQFSSSIKLNLIQADVNELFFTGEKWDIIMCVSGLHHVVELENLIKFCHYSIEDDGELWCIGEAVGPNGNRLWPEAYNEANMFFKSLPEKYRYNKFNNNVDLSILINDFSANCFEGIRSEDIIDIIECWFCPVDVLLYKCFLGRVIGPAYSDNYDLSNTTDVYWLKEAVKAEIEHYINGGRGRALFGVYSPKKF